MELRQLNPALQKKAIEELNEEPARIYEDINFIKEWLKKQPHLKVREEDQWILNFLRGCKFSLERTKEKIEMFYTLRTVLPEFFKNRDPMLPEIQEVLTLGCNIPLPKPLGEDGPQVLLIRAGRHNPSKTSLVHIFKTNYLTSDVLINTNDNVIVSGIVILLDLRNVTLGHFSQFSPELVKKTMTAFQEGYPIRPKSIHYIYTPPGFETIFNMFKAFTKEKLKKRLYVHNEDLDALYEHIPQSMLPAEYGGDAGPIDKIAADWKIKVESFRDWFKEDEEYHSIENLRTGKPKTSNELFGIDGSFRQLTID